MAEILPVDFSKSRNALRSTITTFDPFDMVEFLGNFQGIDSISERLAPHFDEARPADRPAYESLVMGLPQAKLAMTFSLQGH